MSACHGSGEVRTKLTSTIFSSSDLLCLKRCLFWYQIFCNFNATYIFDYTLVLLFNLVFTSLPVIVLGALDQDCNSKALLAFPSTYKRGIQSADYTRPLFFISMLDGVYQSLVCFFVPWACWYYFPVVSSDGHSMDNIWMMGTTVAAGAIISANLYAGLAVSSSRTR